MFAKEHQSSGGRGNSLEVGVVGQKKVRPATGAVIIKNTGKKGGGWSGNSCREKKKAVPWGSFHREGENFLEKSKDISALGVGQGPRGCWGGGFPQVLEFKLRGGKSEEAIRHSRTNLSFCLVPAPSHQTLRPKEKRKQRKSPHPDHRRQEGKKTSVYTKKESSGRANLGDQKKTSFPTPGPASKNAGGGATLWEVNRTKEKQATDYRARLKDLISGRKKSSVQVQKESQKPPSRDRQKKTVNFKKGGVVPGPVGARARERQKPLERGSSHMMVFIKNLEKQKQPLRPPNRKGEKKRRTGSAFRGKKTLATSARKQKRGN